MKLDQLTYFLEAAKHEHLGKAAKALAISAGAISHSIAALEEEFGRSLFEKKGKRIHLTEHGKLLVEKAKHLLSEAATLQEELASDQLELRGHFRLAATHMLCSRYLVPAWVKMQNQNSRLTGEIFTLRSSQVAKGIIEGEYDFGICFNPQSHIDLTTSVLKSGQLVIALRRDHPIWKKKSGVLTALSDYPATHPKSFSGIDVCEKHPVFEKFGIKVNPDCLIDSYQVAIDKAATSNSWTFVPDWFVAEERKRLKAVPLPQGWDAPYQVDAVWPRQGPLRHAMSRILANVKELFGNQSLPKK